MPTDDNKVDYIGCLERGLASEYNDRWAERGDPNTGTPLDATMFRVTTEFADDYAKVMNERYNTK